MRALRTYVIAILAGLVPASQTLAQKVPSPPEMRGPLDLVDPVETVAGLQQQLDRLEAQRNNIDQQLAENAASIYDGTSKLLNSSVDAAFGPIFGTSKELSGIQENLTQANAAMRNAQAAAIDAKTALDAGRRDEALRKTEEAIKLAAESKNRYKDAYDQTVAIFKRTNAVITGEMSPAQLKEIAQRYWESRKQLKAAADGSQELVNADAQHKLLIELRGNLNAEINQLTNWKFKVASGQPVQKTTTPVINNVPNPSGVPGKNPAPASGAPVSAKTATPVTPVIGKSRVSQSGAANAPASQGKSAPAVSLENDGARPISALGSTSALTSPEPQSLDLTGKLNPFTSPSPGRATDQQSADSTAGVDLAKLPPAPQAERPINQQIMASETSSSQLSQKAAGGDPQANLDQANLLNDWINGGDRVFKTPQEQSAFYQAYPQLKKYEPIAGCSSAATKCISPATEVLADFKSGKLTLEPASQEGSSKAGAYNLSTVASAEKTTRDVNQEIVASETKLPSTLKKTPAGLTYDPTGLTAAERAGRDVNQEIVASETKLPSTLKKTPAGLTYDPTGLTAAETAGRDVNQEIVASETKLPSTLKKTPDGLTYDPTGLTAAERAARDVNQAIMAKETSPKSFQQQMWDWLAQTFPETTGPGSAGISFGDMSTHIGPGGEKATPSVSACLDPNTCAQRYFNKSFTVTSGDNKVVAGGFGDVNFLGGGYFAANAPGGGAYTVYNAEGKALPIGQIVNPQKASVGEDGTLKTVDSWGNTHDVNLPNVITSGNATIATQQYAYTKSLGGGAVAGTQVLNSTNWDVFDPNGNRIGSYQQVKALGNGAFAVSNDPLGDASPNWTVLDLSGHQIGNGPYTYVAASGSRIAVEKLGDNSFSYLDPPAISQQAQPVQQAAAVPTPTAAPKPVQARSTPAVPLPAVGGQPAIPLPAVGGQSTPAPDTGGIYLPGPQNSKETPGLAAQAESAYTESQRIPPKKKK